MENKLQKDAFITYESDAWFERNKKYLSNYKVEKDEVVALIQQYHLKPTNVLEIGCSAGYRLNALKSLLKTAEVHGIEPSKKAIEYGRQEFPQVNFTHGTADNLSAFADGSMDLVIVGFVLYVVDRQMIFKVISEIDRVLKNNGQLIIVDFFSETSLKTQYQHIKDFSAYSFKQNYDEIFTASKMYYLLDKSTLNHETKQKDATEDYYNKFSVALLKKDIFASYK